MRLRTLSLALGAALLLGAAALAAAAPKLVTYTELLARPRAKADARIAYGADPNQFGELWLPKGRGPYPVVVLIHGGCWQAALPGKELMDYMAADLRDQGVAVWNLEYRRLGGSGGGYPGTFQDAGAGLDKLRALAGPRRLDLRRVVVAGHSAGGHLAAWVGSRGRLPKSSPLWTAHPLKLQAVVTLAGLNDLEAYRTGGPGRCGEPGTVDDLVRGAASPYADTSPAALAPGDTRQVVVAGALDPIVPVKLSSDYAATIERSGKRAELVVFAQAGHFELIDPTSKAGRAVDERLVALAKGSRR